MSLHDLLGRKHPASAALPSYVWAVEEVKGVRVLRLQGDVGKAIGHEVEESNKAAERSGDFERSLLLDFSGTTGSDFSTVAYLVSSLKKHMAKSTHVGIINPPSELLAELEIARLDPLFEIFGSEQEAIAQFGTEDTG